MRYNPKRFVSKGKRGKYRARGGRGNVVSLVKSLIDKSIETKMVTVVVNEFAASTIGSMPITMVPTPASGSASNQRTGNKILPRGIELRYAIHNNSGQEILGRVLILKVHDGTMTTTEIDDQLFEGTGGYDVTENGVVTDCIRKINREQFTVVRDIALTFGSSGLASKEFRHGKEFVKLSGDMMFHDTTTSDPVANKYCVVWLFRQANNDESLGSTLEISHQLSMYYKDA